MNNVLIICPNEEKERLLDEYSKDTNLHNIKFMTKQEYLKNYFFDYNNKTLEYLMTKYNYNLDVCKIYLKNMYPIDINKIYKNTKLNFLKDLKIELLNNNLLIENPSFKEYLKDKTIEVRNYYDLDKYEELAFNYKVEIPESNLNIDVVSCSTMEEEVNDICLKIINLLNNNVDINNIYLSNVQEDYLYTIDKLFKYYNIPINLNSTHSIYSTKVVSNYLKDKTLDLENTDNLPITKKLINVLSSISDIEEDSTVYNKLLIDKLKSTSISNHTYKNAVNIKDIYKTTFTDKDYVFVLSFNQDILPKMYKDIELITDKEKTELDMYTTSELNIRTKKVLVYLLSKIKNLNISYKLSSPFSSYYKSSLINDLHLNEISPITDNLENSNIYNKLRLGEKLDTFYLYGENDNTLDKLNTHFEIPYKKYDNKFTGIDNNIYLGYLSKPLNLSYSAMNNYNECSFKYYINNVLRIDTFEDTFSQFVGNLYHRLLSIMYNEDFDLEKEYKYYLEHTDYTLDIKDRILLVKIKKDLIDLINSLKKQELLTGFNNKLLEKKVEIDLNKEKHHTIFKGFIDKIMYYEHLNNTYYSIVDYKTGFIDTHIEPMKYGLHMQLPVYLYLIKYGHIFNNDKLTGLYYQNILFNYPSCTSTEELEKEKKDRLKLQGYSIDDTSILEIFDTTYESSEYIKSMKYNEEKGFSGYTKVLNDEEVESMANYTKDIIDKVSNDILDSKFTINPKFYDKENISCKFCKYNDLCFMKQKDLKYLTKVENLDFLTVEGGE